MIESSSKYLLKDLISEDSRTKTYYAWDNQLSRTVICVCLKKKVGEKGAREFLLHARMLGQLKHPGLLPIHDMGLIKNNYFYCYRPSPGRTLLSIIKGEAKEHHLDAKSKQLVLILNQIADTVAYLHEEGVTLGKLDLETVSIGKYGEVVITDWTKSKKNDPVKDRELLSIRIKDDLKLLSSLGLSIWFLNPRIIKLNVREWDETAKDLPLELQIVFDRAQLSRGGHYKNARGFQYDINNFFIGKPPASQSNDITFYLKGLYYSRKKAFISSLALVVACMIYLLIQLNPILKSDDKLAQLNLRQERELVDLDPLKEDLKELKDNFKLEQIELNDYDEKLELLTKRNDDAKSTASSLKEKLKQLDTDKNKYNKTLSSLKKRKFDLQQEKELLEKKILSSKLKDPELVIDLPEMTWVDFSETQQSKNSLRKRSVAMRNALAASLESKESWFYNYLHAPIKSEFLQQNFTFPLSNKYFSKSSDGTQALWIGNNKLLKLNIQGIPLWDDIPFENDFKAQSAVFESNSNYIQVLSDKEKVYRVQLQGIGQKWEGPYLWPQPFKSLIPYSPSSSFQVRSILNKSYRYSKLKNSEDDLPPIFEMDEIDLPRSTQSLLISKKGDLYRIENKALWASFTGEHLLDLPKDLLAINFTAGDKNLYTLCKTYLEVFAINEPTSDDQEDFESIIPIGKWVFPRNIHALSTLPNINSQFFWIEFNDGRVFKWNINEQKGTHQLGIEGSPLLCFNEDLITIKNQTLFHYNMSPISPRKITFDQNYTDELEDNLNDPFYFGENKTWATEDDPYYLTITERKVEVKSSTTKEVVAVIAYSPRPLEKITYSAKDNKIYALDERGELLSW